MEIEEIKKICANDLTRIFKWMENELAGREMPTLNINTNYFILSVLENSDSLAYQVLDDSLTRSTLNSLTDTFQQLVKNGTISAIRPNRKPIYSPELMHYFSDAMNLIPEVIGSKCISSCHVLLAILKNNSDANNIRKMFNKVGITYEILLNKVIALYEDETNAEETNQVSEDNPETLSPADVFRKITGLGKGVEIKGLPNSEVHIVDMTGMGDPTGIIQALNGNSPMQSKKNKNASLNNYCINLNKEYKEGRIDKVVGRENETQEIIAALGRRKKNSIIIVGADGIGKTCICEGLACKIEDGEVPSFLANKEIYALNMTALIAGTQFRGMLEERVKGIIEELKKHGNAILLIDDIHVAFAEKSNNDLGLSSMFSSSIKNGDIQIIGTSSFKGYRNVFDSNPNLSRLFQKVNITIPSKDDTINVLLKIKEHYEKYHNVIYPEDTIKACVNMAEKYVTERNLPDSAIDILDETGAIFKIMHTDNEGLKNLRLQKRQIEEKIANLKKSDAGDELVNTEQQLDSIIKQLIKEEKRAQEAYESLDKTITVGDIYETVSRRTGVPVNELSEDDKKRLLTIEDRLKAEIIGQDEAISIVCKGLRRNRVGLREGKCILSMMAQGKTGVGKSLLAKKLAKELFGDEKAMVRVDMSEYSDETSVNKLIGSSAGYVGYENGGVLTEAVKNKKYCVLLLDEFEKANDKVYNTFLQVLDEGFLTDNTGQRIDFKNTVIIITTNVGAKKAGMIGGGIGFSNNGEENRREILEKEMKREFPPEFLNRIDDIVYFNPLTEDNLKDIIRLELNKVNNLLQTNGNSMTYTDDVVEKIYSLIEKESEYGARPIRRAIQNEIEDKLADKMLENDYKDHIFHITCFSNQIDIA